MSRTFTKACPSCGQTLRIPAEVGGVTMLCPTCRQIVPSFFRLAGQDLVQAGGSDQPPPLATPVEAAPMRPRTPLLAASGLSRYKRMLGSS